MKALLLTSPAPDPRSSSFRVYERSMPLGLAFIASVLRDQGWDVTIDDLYLNPHKLLRFDDFDLVGVTSTTPCFRGTLEICRESEVAKGYRQWKGLFIVGGPHASVRPNMLPNDGGVDHIVVGEGERAILRIVENRAPFIVQAGRLMELDDLPRPAYDLFDLGLYDTKNKLLPRAERVFYYSSSRGCPYYCTFCSTKSIWQNKYTAFSAERVLDDIDWLNQDFGVDGIFFREDNFMVKSNRIRQICAGLIERNVPVYWAAESRVDNLTPDIVRLIRRAGCRGLYMGIEAGSQRLLDDYNKGYTVEQARQAMKWCRDEGIIVQATFIVDTMHETESDRLETLDFICETRPMFWALSHFTGVPFSPLYIEHLKARQYDKLDDVGLMHCPYNPWPRKTGDIDVDAGDMWIGSPLDMEED